MHLSSADFQKALFQIKIVPQPLPICLHIYFKKNLQFSKNIAKKIKLGFVKWDL